MLKSYKQNKIVRSNLNSITTTEGITIENMVAKFLNNQGEDVERTSEKIFTERKDGVLAGTDIRTDRWDIAIDAMNKSAQSMTAKRASKMNIVKDDDDGKADSMEGTEIK